MDTITTLIDAADLDYQRVQADRDAFYKAQADAAVLINKALENKDIKTLYAIEKEAQIFDLKHHKDENKKIMAVYSLIMSEEYFEESKDTKILDERYRLSTALLGKPEKSTRDEFFEIPLKTISRRIKRDLGKAPRDEANVLANARIAAIKYIIAEQRKFIDAYWGFDTKKTKKAKK